MDRLFLYQLRDKYCYNSDSYFLFDFIEKNLSKYKKISGNVLDIGSGSGILALLFKKQYPLVDIFANEIQDEFIFLTKHNAQINNIKLNLIKGDFLDIDKSNFFDIVISNPPYYPSTVIKSNNTNLLKARYQDSLPLEQFIKKISSILNQNGRAFFCYDEKELFNIGYFCKQYKLNIETIRFLYPKKDKQSSLVMIGCKKNSKSKLKIYPPLIMFEGDDFSDEVKNIYNKYKIDSIKATCN